MIDLGRMIDNTVDRISELHERGERQQRVLRAIEAEISYLEEFSALLGQLKESGLVRQLRKGD